SIFLRSSVHVKPKIYAAQWDPSSIVVGEIYRITIAMLAPFQVDQFKTQGFLKSSKVLSDAEVDVLRAELERVMRESTRPEVPQPISISNLNPSASTPVWQIVNIWEASAPFRRLISHPTIVEEIAQISGARELRLWHDQIQFKPASFGGVNHWHQDWPY